MQTPMISIIVPVYKAEKYIDKCIQSIVNQSYANLEIILVNDGSPDLSGELCDRWAENDPRIKVIHQKNSGASAARNSGLKLASGEYIGFVDSDDYISETMYETLLLTLLDSDKMISCCGAYRVYGDNKTEALSRITKREQKNTEETLDALFYGEIDTAVWSKLFARTVFKGINFPVGEINEEFPILIPMLINSGGIACSGELLYYYRENENSVTSTWIFGDKHSNIVYKNLNRMCEQLHSYGLSGLKSFRYFTAYCAFSCVLPLEKRLPSLGDNSINTYKLYRNVLKQNYKYLIFSRHCSIKNKILCVLILTNLLRPLYRVFYRNHL